MLLILSCITLFNLFIYLLITIKDLEKNKYSEGQKTARVRPIFKVNERNKIGDIGHKYST